MFEKRDNGVYVTEHGVNEVLDAVIDAARFKKMKVSKADSANHVVEFKSAMSFFGMGEKLKAYIDENEEGLTTVMFGNDADSSLVGEIMSMVITLLDNSKSGGAW